MINRICIFFLTLLFGISLVGIPSVYSQEEFSLEELTVTAEKREADLQDTSMSISAITGSEIREKSMTSITEILRDMPNIVISTNGWGAIIVNVRGVGSDLPGGENSTAMNVDGTYNSHAEGGIFGFFDLERVEMLRGPQGTLYGRNASGGVVNVLTAKPNTESIEGYALFEYGSYELLREEGAINVPIDDQTAVRVAFSNIDQEGFMSDGSGAVGGTAVRAKYGYYPSDDVSAILQLTSSKMRGISPASIVPVDDYWSGNYYHSVQHIGYEKYDRRNFKISGDITITAGPGILNFVPSYEIGKNKGWALNRGRLPISHSNTADIQQAGELRYSSLADARAQWVTGIYYYKRESKNPGGTSRNPLPSSSGAISEAAYAQITYPMADIYRFILGGRWSDEALTSDNPNPGGLTGEKHYGGMDWKVGLEVDLTEDVMGYFTVGTGRRPGGYNATDTSFDEETLKSAEIGVKSRFMENRVQLNGDIFYYDYEDYQAVDGWTDYEGNNVQILFNVPSVETYGAELEGDILVGEATMINGSLGYLHSVYTAPFVMHAESDPASTHQMEGETLPHAPAWSMKVSIDHTFSFSRGGTLKPTISARWVDGQYMGVVPKPSQFQEAHVLVDASMRYGSASGNWTLNFWAKNATDKAYMQGAARADVMVGPPRKLGVTLQVTF